MAPLFSKADLNKFWHDVQNEETLICAKFGKGLFSISKVAVKQSGPGFLAYPVYTRCCRALTLALARLSCIYRVLYNWIHRFMFCRFSCSMLFIVIIFWYFVIWKKNTFCNIIWTLLNFIYLLGTQIYARHLEVEHI